jgi:hypothetical protein
MSSCRFAYLSPPWWVTMGYTRPEDFQGYGPAAFQGFTVTPQTSDGTQPGSTATPQTSGDTQPGSTATPQTSGGTQPGSTGGAQPGSTVTPQGLVIAGTVRILQTSGFVAAAGVTVDAHRRTDDATMATTTTDAIGNFFLTVPTGGMPFDGYLALTMSGLIPTRVYVWRPPTSSIQIGNVFLTSSAMLSSLFTSLGLSATPTQAMVAVSMRDSALSELQVDEVAVQQNGVAVGYLFDPSSLGTSDAGIWILNVPPGTATDVSATSKGTNFGPAEITTLQGQMTFALLIDDQQPPPLGRQDIEIGDQPISLVSDGTNIWALGQGNSISIVSASDGSNRGTVPMANTPLAAVTVGTFLWVASTKGLGLEPGGSGYLTQFGSPLTFNLQHQPIALAAVQDDLPEPLFYFVDMFSDSLWRFDPTTGLEIAVGPIAPGSSGLLGPQALLFDGTNFWISNAFNNTVSKMDKYGTWQATFPVGNRPVALAFDGKSIWVGNWYDNTVAKLRADNGQVQKIITTGTGPAGMAFDGANVWVTNSGSNTLTKIRASDGVVLDNFPTGLNPAGVVFDGAHIWVANSGSNTISKY